MPPVLHLKAEELDTPQKRSNYTVGVVGCGHKGIFYASAFAQAGFKVLCTDADPSVAKKMSKGKTVKMEPQAEVKLKSYLTSEQISVSHDRKKAVSQSDVVIIAIGAKVDEQKKPDYSQILSACKQVGEALNQGILVIYGGVAGLGFTEGVLKETLENTSGLKVGKDFGLAYNPKPNADAAFGELEVTVAASDAISLQAAGIVLGTIASNVKKINDAKTAEAATLFWIAKRDTERALANEFAVFCEKLNINFFQASKLLGLNEADFEPAIIEHEHIQDNYLLLDSAENLNAKLRLPALARQINQDMAKHAVNLTQDALRGCEKALRRARVAILGAASQESEAALVKMLELKGAKVTVYDPTVKRQNSAAAKSTLNEAVEGADCIIVLSAEDQFNSLNLKKLKALMKASPAIVDLVGKFEYSEVETEGFLYRGFGKGTR